MDRKVSRYGWIPDLPDQRDLVFDPQLSALSALPITVDLRVSCPTVYDQNVLGSCTANAIAAAIEFDLMKQKLPVVTPSRLFIYYNERKIEGQIAHDSGAMIRDGIKSCAKQGTCPESMWIYDIKKFASKPTTKCYTIAAKHKIVKYESVRQDPLHIKTCLASGSPIVFGFTVYESFESDSVAKTGVVPMPDKQEKVLGGHAVLIVGFSDADQRFIIRNSWGTSWGQKGYFTLPFDYVLNLNLADDFWTIYTTQ